MVTECYRHLTIHKLNNKNKLYTVFNLRLFYACYFFFLFYSFSHSKTRQFYWTSTLNCATFSWCPDDRRRGRSLQKTVSGVTTAHTVLLFLFDCMHQLKQLREDTHEILGIKSMFQNCRCHQRTFVEPMFSGEVGERWRCRRGLLSGHFIFFSAISTNSETNFTGSVFSHFFSSFFICQVVYFC